VKTSSFKTYFGAGRISIARWAPRNCPAGYRVYRALAPGDWFNQVDRAEYLVRYAEILAALDPAAVWIELHDLVAPHQPILMC